MDVNSIQINVPLFKQPPPDFQPSNSGRKNSFLPGRNPGGLIWWDSPPDER